MPENLWSNIFAGLALLVSLVSIYLNSKFNKRQNEFDETAERLNAILIEKETLEAIEKSKAYVSANFVQRSRNSYQLRIFNSSQAPAENIRMEILEGGDLFIQSDLTDKFPIEKLDRHGSVNLIDAPCHGSSTKAKMKLTWDDATGVDHENVVSPHVF